MTRENIGINQDCIDSLSINHLLNDSNGLQMSGHITDRIFKNGVLVEERVGHNLVVNSFITLVMSLLKQEEGFNGIQYWAIGSGDDSWDSKLPSPSANETLLTSEIGRVPISPSEISFLDSSFNIVSTPTPILQIKHVFGTSDLNGVWREFGIFGGNATSELNSGILINKKHHSVITKTDDMTVERTMRFNLNLA